MRDAVISAALQDTQWANWARKPIAGDASARRYWRLSMQGHPPAILMDDPPNGTGATTRFADIATALTGIGLAAPAIHHHDTALGLMVIGDLGPTDFAAHLRDNPDEEATLYGAATDILVALHLQPWSLPLSTITPPVAAEMIDLVAIHYAATPAALSDLTHAMQGAYSQLVDPTPHLALRDFHAENLIWRPDLGGTQRVGLLDFQDACYAPAGYDLMSLLRDARRDVVPSVATQAITQFCTATGADHRSMSAHLACVSAQRNLRILGIFARLAKQDGKLKYLALLPRVWGHLSRDLAHPALVNLKQVVDAALPPPDAKTLQRLGAV